MKDSTFKKILLTALTLFLAFCVGLSMVLIPGAMLLVFG